MVVGEGLLSAARFALRVVACGNALSLALESNLGRSFSSFPAWAEYLIADSLGSSGTFEVMVVGEGFEPSKSMTADLQSWEVPFGDGGGGRIRSGTPRSGNSNFEVMLEMVVGKDYSSLRSSPFGPLPVATFSRFRSNRTLVEGSHPSPMSANFHNLTEVTTSLW